MLSKDCGSSIVYRGVFSRLPRRRLSAFAARLSIEVARGAGFTCLITNDRALQELNLQFRNKDYPTDVLSFPSEGAETTGLTPAAGSSAGGRWLGDIAISEQRAAEQAAELGHTRAEEIQVLMLHGVLHLLGYDHETDKGRMRRAETRWRKRFHLPATLTERTAS